MKRISERETRLLILSLGGVSHSAQAFIEDLSCSAHPRSFPRAAAHNTASLLQSATCHCLIKHVVILQRTDILININIGIQIVLLRGPSFDDENYLNS